MKNPKLKGMADESKSNRPQWPIGKTDHATARAYAKKGWNGHACRSDWEATLRYEGVMHL